MLTVFSFEIRTFLFDNNIICRNQTLGMTAVQNVVSVGLGTARARDLTRKKPTKWPARAAMKIPRLKDMTESMTK